jgi:hypothetical protein
MQLNVTLWNVPLSGCVDNTSQRAMLKPEIQHSRSPASNNLDRRNASRGNIFHHITDLDGRRITHGDMHT